jgi:hypothetical protein
VNKLINNFNGECMKRSDMVQFIKETLAKVPAKKDGTHSDFDCDFLLREIEKAGMKAPQVRVLTPLGSRIVFETNEWEEDINVDESGYDMTDPDRDQSILKAKIIK